MFWRLDQLEPTHRERIAALSQARADEAWLAYFRSHYRPRTLGICSAAGLLGGVAMAIAAYTGHAEGRNASGFWGPVCWTAAAVCALYGAISLAAWIRTAGSVVKPFILVTPSAILKVGHGRGNLQGYRLRDATKFEMVTEYSHFQRYSGTAYQFVFPEGRFNLKEKDAARKRRLDSVLAEAKAGGSKANDPLFPEGGRPKASFDFDFFDPLSPFWIQTGLVVGLIACLALIIAVNRS